MNSAILSLAVILMTSAYVMAAPGIHGHGGHGHGHQQVDYYAHPHYQYSYGVNDHHTGDQKTASEQRDGHNVKGHYSLKEADGSWRHVSYYDNGHGFMAEVSRTPAAHGHGHGHGGLGGGLGGGQGGF